MTGTRQFPCQPESVAAARHFVRDALGGRAREFVEAAELMTSELATNAIRHARSDFELTIRTTKDEVRVEVRDNGDGQPTLGAPSPREHSGRGLRIVEAMADAWGITPTTSGKLVWFTLPVHEHEQAKTQVAESAASHELNPKGTDPAEIPNPRPDPAARSECPTSTAHAVYRSRKHEAQARCNGRRPRCRSCRLRRSPGRRCP